MKYILMICGLAFGLSSYSQSTDSTRKEFLAILTLTENFKDEKNWTPKEQAIVGEHFQRLVKYRAEEKVVLAGRTEYEINNPDMMGIVIFYAADEKEARQFMNDDPAVKNKIMQVKTHPYNIAVKCR